MSDVKIKNAKITDNKALDSIIFVSKADSLSIEKTQVI